MTRSEIKAILDHLLSLTHETECVEFKEAKNNYDFNKLGKYFSALSNEANLNNKPEAWLIFGVNKRQQIVGSSYRNDETSLDHLKHEIAEHTNNRITFSGIYELKTANGRVVLFKIPPAHRGMPTSWKGHYYGREGESLKPLSMNEIELIRGQSPNNDWSAEICEKASVEDLSKEAIEEAKKQYGIKNPKLTDDINLWDDVTFLNKAKITIDGKITNAAIVLLGKAESTHFLSPSVARVTWILKDDNNIEIDYEHFDPPLFLNTNKVLNKIRNLKYRYMPDDTLFPVEINMYDNFVIREALHNCIAHQDYSLNSRIIVVESPDSLIFTNAGSFIPGSVEKVIEQDAPQKFYRNKFLVEAMVNLNMIDTIGSGIKKMFLTQKQRFFPLPSYELSESDVSVKIFGKVIDENYTRFLINHANIDIETAILLDKVQKKEKISLNHSKKLRKLGFVEGRYPNIYVSGKISDISNNKTTYIKNRGFGKIYYKDLIVEYLNKFKVATRKDFDNLLMDKLPDILSPEQKKNKIRNILYEMSSKDKTIFNDGSDRKPAWKLSSKK